MADTDWKQHFLPKAAAALEPFITALQVEPGMTIERAATAAAIVATAIQHEMGSSLLTIATRAGDDALPSAYRGLAKSLMSIGISEGLAAETETRLEGQRHTQSKSARKV